MVLLLTSAEYTAASIYMRRVFMQDENMLSKLRCIIAPFITNSNDT